MTVLSRSLFYSLLIHIGLLSLFLFTSMHNPKKESKTALKLKMISLSSPASPALAHKPTLIQPKQEVKPLPVHKETPIIPTPMVQKTIAPVPMIQPAPKVTPPPIARPIPATTASVPPSPSMEVPKIVRPIVTPSVNVEKEFLDAHLGAIRALLIQNLKYPKNAQRLKMQGEVRVGFRLKSDGSVENIEVIQSSGFELLDEDAKALIKNTAPQFPKPSKSISLNIPLSYLLR